MSESTSRQTESCGVAIPLWLQVGVWALGLAACVLGMLNLIAEWSPGLATTQLIVLAVAPVIYMLPKRVRSNAVLEVEKRRASDTARASSKMGLIRDWVCCLVIGGISFGIHAGIGAQIGDVPPAYHDEFSYLFQAQTLLTGRLTVPSHPVHPELFDQMHVLNEGCMASRYYPGTGIWLAPFVLIGHPFLGQWVAGCLATMLIFWTGREIGGCVTGCIAGLAMALSPGIGLFGNTLLAHHPALLALSLFLLGMTRWRRTRSSMDAFVAGCGLSSAMLCRPMTAAAVGLPFGLDVLMWLIWGQRPGKEELNQLAEALIRRPQRAGTVLGFGIPIVLGWLMMLVYNHAVSGEWLTSPYQLYTDLYTPRHVYGFNNVVRGEQHLGPKVIAYDRWATNLTPEIAAHNAFIRWIASWLWTFDGLPLLMATVLILCLSPWLDRRLLLVTLSIVSLHAAHVPYWFVGIMGWHYVFESAPLWCLILGGASALLFTDWSRRGHLGLPIWWSLLLAVSVGGIYLSPAKIWESRLQRGLNPLRHPRQRHAELRKWVEQRVNHRPALVLLEQEETINSHLDLVVNEPGLNGDLILGRYRPGETDIAQIRRDFPDRSLYVACPERHTIRQIE